MQKLLPIVPLILALFSCSRSGPAKPVPYTDPSQYLVSTYTHITGTSELLSGVATDARDTLYVCGLAGHIWKVRPDGTDSLLATVSGAATDIVYDGTDSNLYVAVGNPNSIVRITRTGIVSNFAVGSLANFAGPNAIDIDEEGTFYVADYMSIRKVDPSGHVTTLWKDPANSTQLEAITVDSHHTIYYATRYEVWRLDSVGNPTFVAGRAGQVSSDGTGSAATFTDISELRTDSKGNLWAADGSQVRQITPAGVVTTAAGNGITGFADGTGNVAEFAYAVGLAIDPAGTVFVADNANQKIRKIVHQ